MNSDLFSGHFTFSPRTNIYIVLYGCETWSLTYVCVCVCRDSLVVTATPYGLGGPGIESQWGARVSAPVQTGPGAHPASYIMGTRSFPGVKRTGRGADHPPNLASKLKEE